MRELRFVGKRERHNEQSRDVKAVAKEMGCDPKFVRELADAPERARKLTQNQLDNLYSQLPHQ